MPQLNIRIDAELAALFHEMCAKHETTASEVMRKAIATFVERDMAVQREWDDIDPREAIAFIDKHGAEIDRMGSTRRFPKAPFGSRLKTEKGKK